MIWEAMEKGMAAAAWIVGFMAVLGLMIAFLYLFCVIMMWAFGDKDDEEEVGDDDTAAEAIAECGSAGVHAPTVGRHLRGRAGGDD